MQAISIAIGKAGVNFFAHHYLVDNLIGLLNKLTPPNRTIPVPNFNVGEWKYRDIFVDLVNGSLRGFSPGFQSITQDVTKDSQKTPIFKLIFQARNFSAGYSWTERYHWEHDWYADYDWNHQDGNANNRLSYDGPSFESLTATVEVQFQYVSADHAWEIKVSNTSADTNGERANVPSNSILQSQVQHCFEHEVDEATAHAVAQINFAKPINDLLQNIVQSIPDSGDLGEGIKYDFSLGDSGLLFPNNNGIQMGVKGGSSYKGTPFPGSNPPSLPLPAPLPDSDNHHLNMYVSNYEVDALNWGYYKAGKLNLTVRPEQLPTSDPLQVQTYTSLEPALEPYAAFVMEAEVVQNAAPVSSFQTVYYYTEEVRKYLEKQLPPDVFQLIRALFGKVYLTQGDLDKFLTQAKVQQTYFARIESAGKTTAMVVTQDITYRLVIQNDEKEKPYIKFKVKRVDVMTNLKLGHSVNNTQTLQFGFTNATNTVKYIESSIPDFNGAVFEGPVWHVTAEPVYVQTLQKLGEIGVPLPIMQGFHFIFDQAQISVQLGFVSILANVEFVAHKAFKAVY